MGPRFPIWRNLPCPKTSATLYHGLAQGEVIDLVGLGAFTFTAATSATVSRATLIERLPYVYIAFANADTQATVSVEVVAQGHYEAAEYRLV